MVVEIISRPHEGGVRRDGVAVSDDGAFITLLWITNLTANVRPGAS